MTAETIKKWRENPLFKNKKLRRMGLAGLAVLFIAGILFYAYFSTHVSTDDAFVEGDVVVISPRVKGTILSTSVKDNQYVHRGDLLVTLDERDYAALADAAQAQVQSAEAEAEQAHLDLKRYKQLTLNDEISKQKLDEAEMHAKVADAKLAQAKANLEQAKLNLSYTKIVAPCDGRVTRKSAESGSYVQTGQALMAIVPPGRWITANLKETQLTHVRKGQSATIKIDAYPGMTLKGHVDSIQRGTGSRFSLLPPENATGNYVKVVQRVPVKIILDEKLDPSRPLALGMSAVPTITTR